jgi:serine/threonine protein kinase
LIPRRKVAKLAFDLIMVVRYMHNKLLLAHCDLKLENVLLDTNYCVKLKGFASIVKLGSKLINSIFDNVISSYLKKSWF